MRKTTICLLFIVGVLCTSCGVSGTAAYAPSAGASTECTQMTGDGSCIVLVSESGINVEVATDMALKTAVYCLLFDGIQGSSKNRIQPILPLITNESTREGSKDYFKSFFKNGLYRSYAGTVPGTVPSVTRTSKGYKVTVSVILKKEQLRKKLEKDNIIKSLSNVI